MAHEPLKYIVNVLEECQAHNEDDMCLGLKEALPSLAAVGPRACKRLAPS